MRLHVLSLLLLSACARGRAPAPIVQEAPPRALVLISLDGFRWDYMDREDTPTLDALAASGARAEAMVPSFPTKTFPNHYTLVTGLYPQNHGIISNRFYDPGFDDRFSLRDQKGVQEGRWWGGEPIWVTAERQGTKAATLFWPGSEAEIGGARPSYWEVYDAGLANEDRVDQALSWLELPDGRRPGLVTLYFSVVDTMGHRYGPDSEQVSKAVRAVDGYLGRLIEGLEARGLREHTDLVIVSDHGMAAVSPERFISVAGQVDLDKVELVGSSPLMMIWPEEGTLDATAAALADAHDHLRVYRKDEVPARLHFSDSERIPPLVAFADPGWSVGRGSLLEKLVSMETSGAHGYDNAEEDMHAFFLAQGPSFAEGVTLPAFDNIHVYELLAEALGVEAAPNDGDPAVLRAALRADPG